MCTGIVNLIANSQTEGVRTRRRPRSRWWERVWTDLRREVLRIGRKYIAIGMNGKPVRRRRFTCLCRAKKKKKKVEEEEEEERRRRRRKKKMIKKKEEEEVEDEDYDDDDDDDEEE